MTIIILLFILITLIPSKIVRYNDQFLSKDNTNIVKGFFLLLVFVRHFIQYKLPFSDQWIDTIGLKIDSKLGQLIVVMFLFYSGYGIMESAKKKGKEYVEKLPTKRILPTWTKFAFAVLIYMFVTQYFVKNEFSLSKLVLSLIGWDSFGNSNWYIFGIVILYFIAYLSLKAFNDNKKIIISTLLGTIIFTIIMRYYKQPYWYNTVFCFDLGILISLYKEKITGFTKDNWLMSMIYSLALFMISYKLKNNIIWYYINTIFFTIIVLLLTQKIELKNVLVKWLGKNLFPLYIYQRLPMILLNDVPYFHNNPYIFFAAVLISTIIIAIVYNGVLFVINKCKQKILEKKTIEANN